MKRVTTTLGAAAALAMSVSAAQALELTYGSYTSPTHTTYINGVFPTFDRITKRTSGELTFEKFTGGAMGGPKELLGNVKNNILDSASVVDIYNKAALPVSAMLSSMIIIGDDPKVMAAAMNEMQLLHCPECKKERDKSNVVGLSWSATGSYHVICKDPIKGLADLQGLKIRATSSVGVAMKAIGAAPVSITTAEMYEALQRGQIKCVAGATAWLNTYNLKDFAKGAWTNSLGSYFGTMNLAMNRDVWDDLDTKFQDAIKSEMAQNVADIMWAYVEDNEKGVQLLREKGGDVRVADQAFLDAWKAQQDLAFENAIAKAKADGIENAEETIATFQGLIAKWTKIVAETGNDKDAYRQALQDEIFSKAM